MTLTDDLPGADDLELVAGPETTAPEEAKGLSLLRQADQRRSGRRKTQFFEVPSWGGDLIAEYKVVERARLEGLIRKIQQEQRNNNAAQRTLADIALILEANVGIYARDAEQDGDDAQRVPIEDAAGIVTYDRIGPILGDVRKRNADGTTDEDSETFQIRNGRDAVIYLMAESVSISAHSMLIARWMRDPSKDPATLEATG